MSGIGVSGVFVLFIFEKNYVFIYTHITIALNSVRSCLEDTIGFFFAFIRISAVDSSDDRVYSLI